MKRIIEFYKENNNYIFEEKNGKKIEIDAKEKILNGLELYNVFFKDYSIEDTFDIVDKTTDDIKKNDKMCLAIYIKVKELFKNIEDTLKSELKSQNNTQ